MARRSGRTSGVDIYAGFSATEILYDQDTNIIGVVTGDMGRHRDGSKKEGFQSGIEILAKYTILPKGPAVVWLKN